MAMTNYPYPTSFLSPMPGWPVTESCRPYEEFEVQTSVVDKVKDLLHSVYDEITGDSEFSERELGLLKASRESVGIYYNYTGQAPCFDLDGDETPDLDADGWYVLACNELAMPMAPDGINDMFLADPYDEEAYAANCEKEYGVTP